MAEHHEHHAADPVAHHAGNAAQATGLKKKIGPLPLWSWIAIIGGTLAVLYFVKRGSGSTAAANNSTAVDPNNPLGLTYAEEQSDISQGIDPNTGESYASEQATSDSSSDGDSGSGGGGDSGTGSTDSGDADSDGFSQLDADLNTGLGQIDSDLVNGNQTTASGLAQVDSDVQTTDSDTNSNANTLAGILAGAAAPAAQNAPPAASTTTKAAAKSSGNAQKAATHDANKAIGIGRAALRGGVKVKPIAVKVNHKPAGVGRTGGKPVAVHHPAAHNPAPHKVVVKGKKR